MALGRERVRIGTYHPPPMHDTANARHRPMQMTACIVETATGAAGDGVEVDMFDPSAAPADANHGRPCSSNTTSTGC